ncbi:hypothetical protein GDO81_017210 [Engystomops pustulosus]|uniref:Uncharacterized protein n=1 Tax=Engystomops pustulosus TaxID=76066 RepID=A0AAV7ABM4_ENGPU|nr:hypothetical protein GDO81_017210 [Engystomops pustulosus]
MQITEGNKSLWGPQKNDFKRTSRVPAAEIFGGRPGLNTDGCIQESSKELLFFQLQLLPFDLELLAVPGYSSCGARSAPTSTHRSLVQFLCVTGSGASSRSAATLLPCQPPGNGSCWAVSAMAEGADGACELCPEHGRGRERRSGVTELSLVEAAKAAPRRSSIIKHEHYKGNCYLGRCESPTIVNRIPSPRSLLLLL